MIRLSSRRAATILNQQCTIWWHKKDTLEKCLSAVLANIAGATERLSSVSSPESWHRDKANVMRTILRDDVAGRRALYRWTLYKPAAAPLSLIPLRALQLVIASTFGLKDATQQMEGR